jgi:hypothetical protein
MITSTVARRFFAGVIGHRLPIIGLVLAGVAAAIVSMRGIAVDNSLSSHFVEGDPAYEAYRTFCDDFDAGESIYVAVRLPNRLDRDEYALLRDLTETLALRVPNVASKARDVLSISRAPLFRAVDDELTVLAPDRPNDPDGTGFDELRAAIAAHPMYRGLLVSEDLGHAVLAVTIRQPPGRDARGTWQEASTAAVFTVLGEPRFQSLEAHVVGLPVLSTAYGAMTRRETARGAIVAALLICLLLLVCHQNFRGVVLPLTVVVASLIIVFGLLAACSSFSITTTILPPLILAIGVCASNHVISAYDSCLRTAPSPRDALVEALRRTSRPALLAATTTAAGFLSFAVVPIPAVRDTGLLAAAGTLIAFALSYTLLPALLSFSRGRGSLAREAAPATPSRLDRILLAIVEPAISRPWVVIAGAFVLTAAAGIGVSRLRIETDWLAKFDADSRIARDYAVFDSRLGGTQSLEVLLTSRDPVALADLETLRRIDDLASRIASLPGTRRVVSPVDVVKQANMTLAGDDPARYRLPGTQMELDDLVLAGGAAEAAKAFRYLSMDRRQVRLTVRTVNLPDQRIAALLERIESEEARPLAGLFEVSTTGVAVLALRTFDCIERSQRLGLLLAFAAISLLMTLALGTPSMGLVSMLPNIMPVAWTAGLMGLFDVPLDTAVMMVAAIAIGVAVDDTIHIAHRVRDEADGGSRDPREAISRSIIAVGRPVLYTSLVLGAGFLSLAFSEMKNIARFGALSGLTVILAWIADMWVLPALLGVLRPLWPEPTSPNRLADPQPLDPTESSRL